MTRVALIACGKSKAPQAEYARDLYTGDLFRKSRAWAEHHALPWFVLSARYGLVAPDQVIEPYEATLIGETPFRREKWAREVLVELRRRELIPGRFVILAGLEYRRDLQPALEALAGCEVETPLHGLGMGRQKQWLAWAVANTQGVPA